MNNKSIDDLTQEETKQVIKEIAYIQEYLKDLIFINCVTSCKYSRRIFILFWKLIEIQM